MNSFSVGKIDGSSESGVISIFSPFLHKAIAVHPIVAEYRVAVNIPAIRKKSQDRAAEASGNARSSQESGSGRAPDKAAVVTETPARSENLAVAYSLDAVNQMHIPA
ncbi:MAG: hypothetical protein PHW76_09295 [Alphaproteobacteria bacterium]|nr:hypothetical protein [Alphaproteobacteria bacterium]